jgi:hypothetical protein
VKKTYSELTALTKTFIRKVHDNTPQVGAIALAWNLGEEKTPVAIHVHTRGAVDHKVVKHLLASLASQIDANETLDAQGMLVTPGGIMVPKERKLIIT